MFLCDNAINTFNGDALGKYDGFEKLKNIKYEKGVFVFWNSYGGCSREVKFMLSA